MESEKRLVSIITPCYNTGNLVHYLLDSILQQDYPYIEMYAVDDGSTDNTADVIKSYIYRFEAKGYSLSYIYQENSGQSVAINNALKLVRGEYLVWPDSDDYYSTSVAITRMVSVLDDNEEISMVRCLPEYISEDTREVQNKQQPSTRMDLFTDCLFGENNFWFCSGGFMVKISVLDERIPERNIYTEKNAGQNWQLLLPCLYDKKCITINEYHYCILSRNASHSREQYRTFEEQCCRIDSYGNTLIATIEHLNVLPETEKAKYLDRIHMTLVRDRMYLCIKFGKRKEAKLLKRELENKYHVCLSLKRKIDYYGSRFSGYWMFKKLYNRVRADVNSLFS